MARERKEPQEPIRQREIRQRFAWLYVRNPDSPVGQLAKQAGTTSRTPQKWAYEFLESPNGKKLVKKERDLFDEEIATAKRDAEEKAVDPTFAQAISPFERMRLAADIKILDAVGLFALRSNLAQASIADWTELHLETDKEGKPVLVDGRPSYKLVVVPEKGLMMGHGHHVKRLKWDPKKGWDITLIDSTQERNALGRYLGLDRSWDDGDRIDAQAAERKERVREVFKSLPPEVQKQVYIALLREGRRDDEPITASS